MKKMPKKGYKQTEEHKRKTSELHKGKPKSKEHRRKISESKKGVARPNIKGNNHPTKRLEVRKKMSDSHKGKCGILASNWKGGISYEPYCDIWLDKEFKESIKERDGYKCLNPVCSKISKKLCIHHIDYIKKNCHPLNLITLCVSCNGKANKDREWHTSWYKTIIYQRYNKFL